MQSTENGEHNGEIQEEFSCNYKGEIDEELSFRYYSTQRVETKEEDVSSSSGTSTKLMDYIPIYIPTIEPGLTEKNSNRRKRFFDFRRKISWKSLVQSFKKWIRSPANVALFIWLLLCAVGLFILFLLMTGILNGAVPGSERRKKWEEVVNQILNALFTMMCVYQHPTLFHHLLLVLRWGPKDQVEARRVYSKNGLRRLHDRAHMLFVVALLHLTCAAQYVYCALFWGWSREDRPGLPQGLTIGISTGAPVIAAWYTFYGPLGKNKVEPSIVTNPSEAETETETEPDLHNSRVAVTSPEWIGGLFDCSADKTVAGLSFFCTFCVFGWNMERLGLGNMYVHTVTFALLCIAPFFIFSMSALNIDDETIRIVVAVAGAICCVFGLLYGGYWRSKMRAKFKLPGGSTCCGYPLMSDFARWLFCWWCSLAQEVRTASFYDIEDDGFYRKVEDEEGRRVLVPLLREGHLMVMNHIDSYYRSSSCPPRIEDSGELRGRGNSGGACALFELSINCRSASMYSRIPAMRPPLPPVMKVEDD